MNSTKTQLTSIKGKIVRLLAKNGINKSTRVGKAAASAISSYSKGYDLDIWTASLRLSTKDNKQAKQIATILTDAGFNVELDSNAMSIVA